MITVFLDNREVRATNISWSNVDPGGFEACSFTVSATDAFPSPGAPIRICDGLQLLWEGRVEEPGEDYTTETAFAQVSGVGYGARLKDDTMSMIFIDRDLNAWKGMSVQRQANLGVNYDPKQDPTVEPDSSTGAPALKLSVDGVINGSSGGLCEAMYDAGDGNLIGQVQFQSTTLNNISGGGATWDFTLSSSTDDVLTSNATEAGDYNDGSASFTRETFATPRRWARFLLHWTTTAAGSGQRYRMVQNIAVIGDHTVTLQQNGAGTDGYYPSDIANYVRSLASNIDAGKIESASSFTVIHAPYRERVTYEQIIDDMSRFMGWHWGVWEPISRMHTNPRLDFCARPTSPTITVNRQDCSQVTLSKSLSTMYNRARVAYTDPFGAKTYTLVTLNNPALTFTRTIDLDIGIGTSALATTYGTQILQLSQSDAKAQGSLTLPVTYLDANGAVKPSHYARAGLDRIRIQGLRADRWLESTTSDYRVKRVACQAQGNNIVTTLEIDNGADLVEVLQARLGQAAFGSQSGGKTAFVDRGRPIGIR